jgi:hypothetical protein
VGITVLKRAREGLIEKAGILVALESSYFQDFLPP